MENAPYKDLPNLAKGEKHGLSQGEQEIVYSRTQNTQQTLTDADRKLLDQIEKHIHEIKDEVGKEGGGRLPKNVAIVGHVGVGKSAFINTAIAALSQERWREHAYSGFHGGQAQAVTANLAV